MKIEILSRNYRANDRLKELIEDKISRLEKYFGNDAKAKVVCSEQNKIKKMEITITNKGLLYRSEVTSDNMYENIDLALPKIEKQIVRASEKLKDKKKKTKEVPMFEFIDEIPAPLPEVYKKKSFDLDPLTVEDAVDYMARLGHSFFIFLNAETGKVNVLYKRNDEKLGLIEVNY